MRLLVRAFLVAILLFLSRFLFLLLLLRLDGSRLGGLALLPGGHLLVTRQFGVAESGCFQLVRVQRARLDGLPGALTRHLGRCR
jgi:hypothetical protein